MGEEVNQSEVLTEPFIDEEAQAVLGNRNRNEVALTPQELMQKLFEKQSRLGEESTLFLNRDIWYIGYHKDPDTIAPDGVRQAGKERVSLLLLPKGRFLTKRGMERAEQLEKDFADLNAMQRKIYEENGWSWRIEYKQNQLKQEKMHGNPVIV